MPQLNGVNGSLTNGTPPASPVALLLIDVINPLDCPAAEPVARFATAMAEKVTALKKRAKAAGVPCIYVNDNYGQWRSDFRAITEYSLRPDARGRHMTELLIPEADDYFVLKPSYSGFFATTLDTLLRHLGVRKVILTGVCANVCVLFTAADAAMRGYDLIVPADGLAATTGTESGHALDLMRRIFKAEVHPAAEINVAALAGRVAVDAEEMLKATQGTRNVERPLEPAAAAKSL